jgi:hypothetical protein
MHDILALSNVYVAGYRKAETTFTHRLVGGRTQERMRFLI